MSSKLLWHGYIHVSGTLQVKRFFNHDDIDTSSPFVARYLRPVEADSREEAIEKLTKRMTEF